LKFASVEKAQTLCCKRNESKKEENNKTLELTVFCEFQKKEKATF